MSHSGLGAEEQLGNDWRRNEVAFSIGEGVITIVTPSEKIATHVHNFLPDYSVVQPGSESDETYWIKECAEGWQVGLEGTSIVDTLDSLEDALNATEQLAVTRLLAATPSTAQVHAAGTVVNGEAILLLGAAGAGKTSIALNWNAKGFPVLGDDLVLLAPDGRGLPFRRLFIAPANRLRELGLRPDPDLEWLSDDREEWFNPRSAGGWAEPAPISTLALVQFVPEKEMVASDLSKPAALSALLASLLPTGLDSAKAFDRCAAVVQRARTLQLTFPNAAGAAEFLSSMV